MVDSAWLALLHVCSFFIYEIVSHIEIPLVSLGELSVFMSTK